jgi:hypothetical protein
MTVKETIELVLKCSDYHPYYGELSKNDTYKGAIELAELFLDFAKKGYEDEAMNLSVSHWKLVIEGLKEKYFLFF